MRLKPRLFSSSLGTTERRVYGTVTLVFVATFFATMWPVYPLFSRIRPRVLGVPFSLVYLVMLTAVCFFAILALYLWEERRGALEEGPNDTGARHPGDGARRVAREPEQSA